MREESSGERLTGADREELLRLRKEVKKLRIEGDIKKGQRLLSGGFVFSVTREFWQLLSLAAQASQAY